jgi:hypothetical protein
MMKGGLLKTPFHGRVHGRAFLLDHALDLMIRFIQGSFDG